MNTAISRSFASRTARTLSPLAAIEPLEHRRLLAGNVSVSVDAALNAQILGDNKSNLIEITLEPATADASVGYRITGLKGTKINGVPAVIFRTTTAFNFSISLGNGNDRISFSDTTGQLGTQALAISTGNGKDVVSLTGTTHFGNVSLVTENGNDKVILSAVRVTADLAVSMGNGKDSISVPSLTQIEGSSTIDGGRGKNTLTGSASLSVAGTSLFPNVRSDQVTQKLKTKRGGDDDDDD